MKMFEDRSLPGGWFTSLNAHEAMSFVIGYTTAMGDACAYLRPLLEVSDLFLSPFIPDKFLAVMPNLLEVMIDLWNYKKVPLSELGAYVTAIYSQPENAKLYFDPVFRLSRDVVEKRITQEEFDSKLKELRASGDWNTPKK